jgi:hypothetical protein
MNPPFVGLAEEYRRVRRRFGSGTSLLWLLRHLGRAEAIWVLDRFTGATVDADLLDHGLHAEDTIDTLLERYRRIWQLVDDTVATSDLDEICRGEDDQLNPDLRWVLAHLAGKTARHAGHADILRELLDGDTGR